MVEKTVEIWLYGRKLCEVEESNPALERFESIVRKAGYEIKEKVENKKIIKMI